MNELEIWGRDQREAARLR